MMQFFKKKQQIEVRRPTVLDKSRVYWTGGFFKDLRERFLEHFGETIRVDIRQDYRTVGDETGAFYDRHDYWTAMTSDELHQEGYLKAIRMPGYDSIQWWGQKVYVRLQNYTQFDIHQKDDFGRFIYSQDTPSTLHDEMTSNATQQFIKAMFKTTLPTMDIQKIIMMALLAVGAVFGLMMLGVI
jgi:hypothetical protein